MKHVGERAITGVLLKSVETSRVRTTQGRTYLKKRRLFSLASGTQMLQTHTSRIARVAKLQLKIDW